MPLTEERLHAMVDSASDLGVELFVLMMGGLANEIGTIRHWATGLI